MEWRMSPEDVAHDDAQIQAKGDEEKAAIARKEEEEAVEKKEAAVAAKQQEYEDRENDSWSHQLPLIGPIKETLDHVALGVGDTAFDTAGAVGTLINVPWLKQADQWWDANKPTSIHPFHTGVRDVSAIVIPTLVGQRLVIGGIAGLTKAKQISQATRTLGTIAAAAGVDVSVTAISSQSAEQDNAAGALNKWLGWNIPWGTTDTMSPDVRRKMHIYESGMLSVGVDMLQVVGSFAKKLKLVDADVKATKLLEDSNKQLKKIVGKDADPITEVIEGRRGARATAQLDEGVERLTTSAANPDYDPFIHGGEDAAKAVTDLQPDTVGAKADLYRIQNNIGTVDGQMRTSASKAVQDLITNAGNGSARAKILSDFFENNLQANARAIIEDKQIFPADLDEAVTKLTDSIFNPDVSFKQFENTINESKEIAYGAKKLLGEKEWVEATFAFKRAFDEMWNPDLMKASAMNTQQAADTVTSTAKAADILEGMGVPTIRQQEIINQKMKLLAGEVRANQEIARRTLQMQKLMKEGNPETLTQWLVTQADQFDEVIAAGKSKASELVDTLNAVGKEHPAYLRPLIEAYDATNGNVDTLYKLHQWAEHKIGFIKKGIYDRNPELPSFIVKGLHGVRYNSILSGLAPVRAVTGNALLSTIKPISVFAGAVATGDVGTFKRAMYTYGGFSENIKRGLKVLSNDWRLANSNPEQAIARGRADLKLPSTDHFDAMETMAEGWRVSGKNGKLAMWNWAKGMSYWNNNKFVRFGVNSMFSVDGFTNSLNASGMARARAYDALLESTGGAFSKQDFLDAQRHLYSEAFDSNGVLTDKAAKFASQEIALNLDSGFVSKIETVLDHVPAAKALFLFPRTGANALELSWSFNPLSNLAPSITKARRALMAVEPDEIAEVLADHGIEYGFNMEAAFKQLRSEYIGRQIMGGSVAMSAGLWALEGNLSGNGPQDASERQRMMSMGWKPKSIKHPITGVWHSYEGLEPFEGLLGLVGDFVYQSNRVDQSVMEDFWNKLRYSIVMNVTNETFLSGFEPLVGLMSGDESAWNRFWAMQANTQVLPFAGVRSILNNLISPQIKDVENDWKAYLKNMNRYLFTDDPQLPDMLDIYTGRPIRYHESFNAAANALLPMFKTNGDMEPWRQWLLATGWDGLQKLRKNTLAQTDLTPEDRQWVNNWIAKHGGLKQRIISLMNHPDNYWGKEIAKYKKARGLQNQKDYPIKETLLYDTLNEMHDDVFDKALSALAVFKEPYVHEGRLKRRRDYQIGRGAFDAANDTLGDIRELLQETQD